MVVFQQVIFKLNNEEYGMDIIKINGIEKYQAVVQVPNAPDYVEGIINLRGEVLPIYSLRKKFHLAEKAIDDETRVIVALTNDMKVGFLVDSVTEILNIEEESIDEVPKLLTGINRKYMKSVAKIENRMVILMDVDLLVTDEEKISLGQVVEDVE